MRNKLCAIMYSIAPFILYCVLYMAILLPGLVIHKKLYKNISNEDHREKGKILQRIMKTYSIAHSILWPLSGILVAVVMPESPCWDSINPSAMYYLFVLCGIVRAISRDYTALNSLLIAMCRYFFIVFDVKAEKIGIKRLRKCFIGISIGIPIISAILDMCTISVKEYALYLKYS